MELIVVSGRSGAGKTTALHALEDSGCYCVDNLPCGLLHQLLAHPFPSHTAHPPPLAVSIDVRNPEEHAVDMLEQVRKKNPTLSMHVLFLYATEKILAGRFNNTRRRHPLLIPEQEAASQAAHRFTLGEAIAVEREFLLPLAEYATLSIDTSAMNPHELRDRIRQWRSQEEDIALLFQSFSYVQGIPADSDLVYDARILPNPHWEKALSPLKGTDAAVAAFLDRQERSQILFTSIVEQLQSWLPWFRTNDRRQLHVSFGCSGGRHRSVYMVERLGRYFRERHPNTHTRHLALQSESTKAVQ